jgi:hypothetical protein
MTDERKTQALKIEIGKISRAEKTDRPADPDVKSTAENDFGVSIAEACSDSGHIRSITVNGQCYKQMCCGGQWLFYYKDVGGRRIWCTCNLGESWTINCSGNTWILPCR